MIVVVLLKSTRAQARALEHLNDALDALEAADPGAHAGFASMVAAIIEQVGREIPPA